jgi:hypothetical protein
MDTAFFVVDYAAGEESESCAVSGFRRDDVRRK